MPEYGVTLLSGGLDSTTVATYAKDHVDYISAITFLYGQTHSKEVDCRGADRRNHGRRARIARHLISLESSLVLCPDQPRPISCAERTVPWKRSDTGCPITYVPMRNTIFLSLATAYLESRVLHAIEMEGVDASGVTAAVYMAPNALDYSGYPDCRPEFYEAMRKGLDLGSKLWTEYSEPINVETPIIDLSKSGDSSPWNEARSPVRIHLELL